MCLIETSAREHYCRGSGARSAVRDLCLCFDFTRRSLGTLGATSGTPLPPPSTHAHTRMHERARTRVCVAHTRTDAGTHAGSRGRGAASQVQGEQVCERCGMCLLRLRPMTSGCPTSQVSLVRGARAPARARARGGSYIGHNYIGHNIIIYRP